MSDHEKVIEIIRLKDQAPLVHFFVHHPEIPARPILLLAPMFALLFAPAAYDRLTRGRSHPVTLWGAVILFAWGTCGPPPSGRAKCGTSSRGG